MKTVTKKQLIKKVALYTVSAASLTYLITSINAIETVSTDEELRMLVESKKQNDKKLSYLDAIAIETKEEIKIDNMLKRLKEDNFEIIDDEILEIENELSEENENKNTRKLKYRYR